MASDAIMGINGLTDVLSTVSAGSAGKVKGTASSSLQELTNAGKTEASPFESLLNSAMEMIEETNAYSNEAAEAELAYAMGMTNSTHDVQVAQMKANISLQYTVAVRNAVIDAYKEIMQLQF